MRDGALRDAIARLQRAIASEAGMGAALRFIASMLRERGSGSASPVEPARAEDRRVLSGMSETPDAR